MIWDIKREMLVTEFDSILKSWKLQWEKMDNNYQTCQKLYGLHRIKHGDDMISKETTKILDKMHFDLLSMTFAIQATEELIAQTFKYMDLIEEGVVSAEEAKDMDDEIKMKGNDILLEFRRKQGLK
jgi:hypothetical protein